MPEVGIGIYALGLRYVFPDEAVNLRTLDAHKNSMRKDAPSSMNAGAVSTVHVSVMFHLLFQRGMGLGILRTRTFRVCGGPSPVRLFVSKLNGQQLVVV